METVRSARVRPRVIIVGGGFGGLSAAQALADVDVDVTLIDRTNHYLFQPLLYQVATGVLSPADIAMPLRHLLRRQKNVTVLLGEVASIDLARRVVEADSGRLRAGYDYLIVATGTRHSYFGHPEWEATAPGLKTLDDARQIRRRFLMALERAEKTQDPEEQDALLTFVVIGGGPTGVELAGVIPTIARHGFRHDFRHIDPQRVRVILLEGGPRLLAAFPPALSERAQRDLAELGVQCRVNAMVTRVTDEAVCLGDERIAARTVFWAAGNAASPLVRSMGVDVDRAGRALVNPDLSIPEHPEVFVVGDAAAVVMHEAGNPEPGGRTTYVPGLAAAANQMGQHAAGIIAREIATGSPIAANVDATALASPPSTASRPPFRYRDRGSMAVIGRGRAIATFGRVQLAGVFAWLTWLFVHLLYLAGFRNRLAVLLQWSYSYFTYQPGARLITNDDAHLAEGKPLT